MAASKRDAATAPQRLVAGRRDRDVAEDRGHVEAAVELPSSQRVAPRMRRLPVERREDDRDGPEDGAPEHDPVVAEPVGQDAEDRRQDELGEVERRREHARRSRASTGGASGW